MVSQTDSAAVQRVLIMVRDAQDYLRESCGPLDGRLMHAAEQLRLSESVLRVEVGELRHQENARACL